MPGTVPLHDQTLARLAATYPVVGLAMLHHRSQRGDAMSFSDRPALVEMYADFPKIEGADVVKAPQLGLTEFFIQLALHETGWRGRIVGYVLPTMDVRNRFVANRINSVLRDVPAYRERLPGADREDLRKGDPGNLRFKRVGAGLALFLGAKVDGDFVEFSADTLIIDEYDLCWQQGAENLAKATDRLRESREPRMFLLGNPEIPGGGIDAIYDQGDRRSFHWRCGHCNERQPIVWEENVVDLGDGVPGGTIRDKVARLDPSAPIRPVCRRCGKPFERESRGAAWVPATPSRPRRSYRMARWDKRTQPLRKLHDEWVAAQTSSQLLRLWWRAVAGLAWEATTNKITREMVVDGSVLDAMDHGGGEEYADRTMTCGIDVGAVFNVTVSESVRGAGGRVERRAAWVGTVGSWDACKDVLLRYRIRTACVDEAPEYHGAATFRDWGRSEGITIWLCHFHPQPTVTGEMFAMRRDYKALKVSCDRTQLLDASADDLRLGAALGRALRERGWPDVPVDLRQPGEGVVWAGVPWAELPDPMRDGARLWPTDVDCALGFHDQMMASKRVLRDGKFAWDESGKPDHYRLADAYDLVAWTLAQGAGRFY